MKLVRLKEILIERIQIDSCQSRQRELNESINDLARSMKKIGIIQPIVVQKGHGNNYRLIAGRRRVIAASILGWKKIIAIIAEGNAIHTPMHTIKMLSLSENIVRNEIRKMDVVDSLTSLYEKYGSVNRLSSKTGINDETIRKFVKFARLPAQLKEGVSMGKISLHNALIATDSLMWDRGRKNQEKILKFALALDHMSIIERKYAAKIARADPHRSISEILAKVRDIGYRRKKVVVIEKRASTTQKRGLSSDEGQRTFDEIISKNH